MLIANGDPFVHSQRYSSFGWRTLTMRPGEPVTNVDINTIGKRVDGQHLSLARVVDYRLVSAFLVVGSEENTMRECLGHNSSLEISEEEKNYKS
jgi:hypothetical protein